MCTYEFAEVDPHCSPIPRGLFATMYRNAAVAVPDELSWRPISDDSGQNMLVLKKPKVYASTDRLCQDAQHPNKPKAYLFAWSTPITYCGDAHPAVIPMVKYIHCTRGHAILVRKASELEVEVATTDLECEDGGAVLAKALATVGTATVWEKHIAKTGTPQKLSLVANSIRAAIARQGKGTLQ